LAPVINWSQKELLFWTSFINGGLFVFTLEFFCFSVTTVAGLVNSFGINKKLTLNIFPSKIRHENDDIFGNGLSIKGIEYFWLSNGTNKGIANFRATIPLNVNQK
jgi:hypothetical protein